MILSASFSFPACFEYIDHDDHYAGNNLDNEAYIHVNEDCGEEGDHPDNSIPSGSLAVLRKVHNLQNDSFEASEDDGIRIQTGSRLFPPLTSCTRL